MLHLGLLIEPALEQDFDSHLTRNYVVFLDYYLDVDLEIVRHMDERYFFKPRFINLEFYFECGLYIFAPTDFWPNFPLWLANYALGLLWCCFGEDVLELAQEFFVVCTGPDAIPGTFLPHAEQKLDRV